MEVHGAPIGADGIGSVLISWKVLSVGIWMSTVGSCIALKLSGQFHFVSAARKDCGLPMSRIGFDFLFFCAPQLPVKHEIDVVPDGILELRK